MNIWIINYDDVILFELRNYILNNEIYFIDVYNEINNEYVKIKTDIINTLYSTYFKMYFSSLQINDIMNIYNYVFDINDNTIEEHYMKNNANIIHNYINNENIINNNMDVMMNNYKEKYMGFFGNYKI